jgi:hypothetical protein
LRLKTQNTWAFPLVFLIALISPVFLQNFFRIRSDQMSFALFCGLLVLSFLSKQKYFFLIFFLLCITSLKSVLFLIPLAFLFKNQLIFQLKKMTTQQKLITGGIAFAVLIWVLALNINSLIYAYTVSSLNTFNFGPLKKSLQNDWPLFIFNFFAFIWHFNKTKWDQASLWVSGYCLLILLISPQAFPFYVASFIFLYLLPTWMFFLNTQISVRKRVVTLSALIFLQATVFIYNVQTQSQKIYSFNHDQLKYIEVVGQFVKAHDLTYLDGAGILPRERLNPCLISPDDELANQSCKNKVMNHEAESYIITQRLSFLGDTIIKALNADYTQIKPNFWIKNKYLSQIKPEEIDLHSLPIPMLIFGGDQN